MINGGVGLQRETLYTSSIYTGGKMIQVFSATIDIKWHYSWLKIDLFLVVVACHWLVCVWDNVFLPAIIKLSKKLLVNNSARKPVVLAACHVTGEYVPQKIISLYRTSMCFGEILQNIKEISSRFRKIYNSNLFHFFLFQNYSFVTLVFIIGSILL